MNIQLKTKLEKEEICELYNISSAFLEGRDICKSVYIPKDYTTNIIKEVLEDMYNIAKKNNIPNTEYFFSKEYNKKIFNNIF